MSDRWKMNRMGFVNFWLYDEETFSFADGRLMLRGQNGSGKSITTQSFIPFILDGDRSPSRLDPFGSSDRRMEYYFLGDGTKDEATGYLFLEFKHGDLDRYRTIGIGQRAQKGKPMGFWGFVILDGRRIGQDFDLFRRVGSGRIPLTKKELKELLGEGNVFTDVQKEYMEAVNRHIFGFPSLSSYSQFIRLLIKIRAPKLSKEFKPTKVYEILDDSLQTLTDEDMRAMVEAMEKMDEIQDRLDALNAAFRDTQIIRTEYIRYNQFMLGRKAQAFLDARKEAETHSRLLEEKRHTQEEKRRELALEVQQLEKWSDETDKLTAQMSALHVEDIREAVRRKDEACREKDAALEEKKDLSDRIRGSQAKLVDLEHTLKGYEEQTDLAACEAHKCLDLLSELNRILHFEAHGTAEKLMSAESTKRRSMQEHTLKKLRLLRDSARKAMDSLVKLSERRSQWDEQLKVLEQLQIMLQEAQNLAQQARQHAEEERDALVEQFYILQKNNRLMEIPREILTQWTEMIRAYEGPASLPPLRDDYERLCRIAEEPRQTERFRLRAQLEQFQSEREQLKEELKILQESTLPVPEHSESTDAARKALEDAGIAFLPLYEAIEFAPELPQERRDLIEAQLTDAGVLDALIVSAQDCARAESVLSAHADRLLRPGAAGQGDSTQMLVAANGHESMTQAVADVLRSIHFVDPSVYESHSVQGQAEEAAIWLWEDGRFRHGMLDGFARARQEASYIGVAARRALRQRRIQAKEQEIEEKTRLIDALREQLEQLREELKILGGERLAFPSFQSLDQAIHDESARQMEEERCALDVGRASDTEKQAASLYREAEQQMLSLCRTLPYTRTIEAYQEVLETLEEYQAELGRLDRQIEEADKIRIRSEHTMQSMDQAQEQLDLWFAYRKKVQKKAEELETQIASLCAYLDNPQISQMAHRLEQINGQLAQLDEHIREALVRRGALEDNIASLSGQISSLEESGTTIHERAARTALIFREELALEQNGTPGVQDDEVKRARTAAAAIRESDKNRSAAEITTSLLKVFQAHSGSLSAYGTSLESCFEDDEKYLRARQRISSMWNGQKLYLNEFYQMLNETIESTALLIREKDREMFEGILADTLSRKLSQRIRESRGFIRDMSELMKQLDTSMGLSFSLDWRPKEAQSDSQLDIAELERILSRDKELLTDEDIEKVSSHFRSKMHAARAEALENGEEVNYLDMVRDALDYRKWFDFRLNYYRTGVKKELTDHAFNRLSGGEKAMAMYVPLFAAVNAQYMKAANKDHPRLIALDEAFAGVDDKNIDSMFALVETMDFDYIMNSQVLWGCYASVRTLRIAELLRPLNSDFITVINYTWNGRERVLED